MKDTEKMKSTLVTEFDLHLLAQGQHFHSWEKLGAHCGEQDGINGTYFALWAPNAREVYVLGDFNGWKAGANPLHCLGDSGIWSGFVPGVGHGATYKYHIRSSVGNYKVDKADPYSFACEHRPKTASKVWDLGKHVWGDDAWMQHRGGNNALSAPMSIYEVHLGSWMRVPQEDNRWMTYRELAEKLVPYVHEMGFTHVELLPVLEHPFDGSWGYQITSYFAPTSRFGTPEDFMALVDAFHQKGIGVLLDWVPAHFPRDEHGLGFFDGTHLYEHADPRLGEHEDWGTLIFNYGRWEVRNFLISNALFWMKIYHIDGLRVDAVASMLYLDYSRKEGEWLPNEHGGRENLPAINFLRSMNEQLYGRHPDTLTTAEESTAWPMVSRPTYLGGLGFGLKWDMGWMHDTLRYFSEDPVHRKYHHNELTFRMVYAFNENFILPLSHDEVVHGKQSLLSKMPGDLWQQFANLRLLYGYMFTQPGKKLLFMGCEFGQWNEWNQDASLDWHLLDNSSHAGLKRLVRDLNTFYRAERALYEWDTQAQGFQWLECNDAEQSVLSYLRKSPDSSDTVLIVCNFTPVPRPNYHVGVPFSGAWEEKLNTDAPIYGGSGQGNLGLVQTHPVSWHGFHSSVQLNLPPLAVVVFKYAAQRKK